MLIEDPFYGKEKKGKSGLNILEEKRVDNLLLLIILLNANSRRPFFLKLPCYSSHLKTINMNSSISNIQYHFSVEFV